MWRCWWGCLKAERRGKQHVALSALEGDWRLATNTKSNRNAEEVEINAAKLCRMYRLRCRVGC